MLPPYDILNVFLFMKAILFMLLGRLHMLRWFTPMICPLLICCCNQESRGVLSIGTSIALLVQVHENGCCLV